MTKYLQTLIGRFEELKHGMTNNIHKWKSMPETPQEIDKQIKEIESVDCEISEVKKQLSKKQEEARSIREAKKSVIQKIEKRAIGLHADEEEKLKEYNIKTKH